ncbi:hypothetical protein CR513_28874, partial [Mucuna pruriens]
MKVTIIKAQIVESQKAPMARFLHGLNRDIQDIVELHEYTSISTLVHQTSRVESQIKRHGNKSYPNTSSNWKGKERREEKLLRKDQSPTKGNAPFKGHRENVSKVNSPNFNTHKSSNIKCFMCLGKEHIASQFPNKRTMNLRDDGDIDRYSSEVSYERDLLMVKIELTLGKYKDKILFYVVPMEATYILLGRPWQFDRKITHDGVTNKFPFSHKGHKVILKSLTPREVIEGKLKMT